MSVIYLIDMAKAELKSKWAIHVRAWMASHPNVSYKDAQKMAKDSYQTAKPAKAVKPIKVKAVKVSKERTPSPWIEHIQQYRTDHPEIKYGDAMREAKVTYGVAKVAPIVNIGVQETKQSGKGVAEEPRKKIREPNLARLHEEIGRIELD